ncbi:uncharacterized protein LOC103940662 isoform X6 [Pyrus x bretschneideri]|uniref:uncharacterized protein LOC103940662 isoform X6 n=1 Tax=Pyrus x bretschneideri TaxID=225117 RepID=UPI00202FD26B|nr:uncharacterized protein LOC103940662 isoform X6 [Pyrus x bretschneideri]
MALLSLPPIVLSLARTDSVHFSRFVLSEYQLTESPPYPPPPPLSQSRPHFRLNLNPPLPLLRRPNRHNLCRLTRSQLSSAEAATVGKVRHRRLVREMRGCWWHNACLIILSLSTSFPGKACPQATSCFL